MFGRKKLKQRIADLEAINKSNGDYIIELLVKIDSKNADLLTEIHLLKSKITLLERELDIATKENQNFKYYLKQEEKCTGEVRVDRIKGITVPDQLANQIDCIDDSGYVAPIRQANGRFKSGRV